jgi:twinkle protein
MAEHEESVFLHKESCPACGSVDNLARYSDGHGHCFGCDHYEHGTEKGDYTPNPRGTSMDTNPDLLDVTIKAIPARGITEATCKRYGYGIGKFNKKTVHVATYKNHKGVAVGQKLRFQDKAEGFPWVGNGTKPPLFGMHIPLKALRQVVVTEGEIDCLTVSQVSDNKWPVVSVPLGAKAAKKSFIQHLEWLSQFDRVVIMFDMDAVGQEAALECAAVLPAGKAAIANLPRHDANEMLQKGDHAQIMDAVFRAEPYQPAGIVTLGSIRDEVLKPVEVGLPWFSPTLTEYTYGRRRGEIYAFGAGTGIGKSDLLIQQVDYDLTILNEKVGLFFLEQQPTETAKRLAGKHAGRRFHIPKDAETNNWLDEELLGAIDALDAHGGLHMFDSFGETNWDVIREVMRFQVHAHGTFLFYIDHLTAMASAEDDERTGLERIMAELGSIVKELNIIIHIISHLATPEGKPHEEGGRVMIRHFKGSRSIGFWCHYMFGLERDQQSNDEAWRSITTFRVLKDRYTGNSTGKLIHFGYDLETGKLFETEPPEPSADSMGFKPEADDAAF